MELIDMSTPDMEFDEFFELMKQTTANLKKLNEANEHMRWQFGEPEEYEEFVKEMDRATTGWISSHC